MSNKTVRMLLQELGPKELYSVQVDNNILTVSTLLEAYGVAALVVLHHDKLVGIISERDLVRKVLSNALDPKATSVSQIMTSDVVTVTPFTNLKECEDLMRERKIRHLPVVENGRVIAVISIRDLLVSTRQELEQLVRDLEKYINPFLHT